MFIPREDSTAKMNPENKPGIFFGSPDTSANGGAKDTTQELQPIRTMKEDIDEENKKQKGAIPAQKAKRNFFSSMWANISGKTQAEALASKIIADQKLIDDKIAEEKRSAEEAERAKATLLAAEALAEKKRADLAVEIEAEKKRIKEEEEAAAKEEAERAKKEAEALAVLEEQKRKEEEARVIMEKEMGRAYAEIATSPEGIKARDRAIETATKKAKEIIASHKNALADTALATTQIIDEKEKMRVKVSEIVKAEEDALRDVAKHIEEDAKNEAILVKKEAARKKEQAQIDLSIAEKSLAKEKIEAETADSSAKKERLDVEAAEVLVIKKRAIAKEATQMEAKEIFTADKKVEIAALAAKKAIESLQKMAHSEAEDISIVQESTRKAEAAEIEKLKT